MPTKYLLLDAKSGLILVTDAKPEPPYTVARTHGKVFCGLPFVWCMPDTPDAVLATAAVAFELRVGNAKLFADVRHAVQQLEQMFDKEGTGYIALGGSPKLVKWALKQRGFKVVTVNASEVKMSATRTVEFEAYLKRKLDKLAGVRTFVVMDFADTGASLAKIKSDILALRPEASAKAVAVGKSPKFDKPDNASLRARVDHVLIGIDDLQDRLYKQSIKTFLLGRNKVKNPYATWSEARSKMLETTSAPGAKGTVHFQQQKAIVPALIDLPEVQVTFDEVYDPPPDVGADSGGDEDYFNDGDEVDFDI